VSLKPLPDQGPGNGDVFNVTAAQRSLSQEQMGRTRKYLFSMAIRTGCLIAAIFVPGWPRWVLIAGAVVLPYVAVVIANAGQDKDTAGDLGVAPGIQTALPASDTSKVITGIIHDPTSAPS